MVITNLTADELGQDYLTDYDTAFHQHSCTSAGGAKSAMDKAMERASKAQTRRGGFNPEDTAALETADFMMTTQAWPRCRCLLACSC